MNAPAEPLQSRTPSPSRPDPSDARLFGLRELLTRFAFPAAIVLLLAANLMLSHAIGQSRTMYDNPIYRWRESIAIALSRLSDTPPGGYLAHRSVRNYLTQNGLGLMDGEATRLPTGQELKSLIYDSKRLEKLFQAAARTPIDQSLSPVTLAGNEKGLSDYYYWAFRLFGINLIGLWLFYFLLLSISVVLFFLTFRRSPLALLLLLLYLIAHLFMIDYARLGHIQTVHNSRFFPVLAVLPSMHLLLLMLERRTATRWIASTACAQVLLLYFVVLCRMEAIWQPLALLAIGALGVRFRALGAALRSQRPRTEVLRTCFLENWPVAIVALGFVCFQLYAIFAQDKKVYGTETRSHVFWHTLYSGTVSASPQLTRLYSLNEEPYSDAISYMAVLADLRGRNDASSEIAHVNDGTIYISMMKNMGAYDRLVRRVFFQIVAEHPFLVLKSFMFDKPIDQVITLKRARFFSPLRYVMIFPLGVVAALLFLTTGWPHLQHSNVTSTGHVLLAILAFSLLPTLIVASPLIVDTLAYLLLLLLLLVTYLTHLTAKAPQWLRYRAQRLQSQRTTR